MTITTIAIADLRRPSRNVRHHPRKQIEELKRSVVMFGQTRALICDENHTVLAGNGLLTALEELGYTEAECYIIAGLSEAGKKKTHAGGQSRIRPWTDGHECFRCHNSVSLMGI